MASKNEWLEYFKFINGRVPTPEEFMKAKLSGDFVEENSDKGPPEVPKNKENGSKSRKRKFWWLFSFIFIALSVIAWFAYQNSRLVTVSGLIKNSSGQPLRNGKVKVGDSTIETDGYGQFVVHVHPSKSYKVNGNKIDFTLQIDDKGSFKATKDISPGLELSTFTKTVKMKVKSGAIFIDKTSHYKIDPKSDRISFNSNLEVKNGDKIVAGPDSSYQGQGFAFTIHGLSYKNGKYMADIKPLHVEDALDSLSVHTGEITGEELTKNLKNQTSPQTLEPTDLTLSWDKANLTAESNSTVKATIKNELSKGSIDKNSTVSASISGQAEITGKFELDADFYFLNPSKSNFKVSDSLNISAELAAELKAKYNDEDILENIATPIPFVSIPISFYMNAEVTAKASVDYSYSPNISVTGDFEKGIQAKFDESRPELSAELSGKISGAEGIKIGPAILFNIPFMKENAEDELLSIGGKFGFNGQAEAKGSFSADGKNEFSGSGNLDFQVIAEIDSPVLNNLSQKFMNGKVKFDLNKVLYQQNLLKSGKVQQEKTKEMDLDAISKGDFTSIQGRWVDKSGNAIVVTKNSIQFHGGGEIGLYNTRKNLTSGTGYHIPGYSRGESSDLPWNSGNSGPLILLTNNYSGVGDGGFWFVPKNISLPSNAFQDNGSDASDSSKERIFIGTGAGQWTEENGAYYREDTSSPESITSNQFKQGDLSNIQGSWNITTNSDDGTVYDKDGNKIIPEGWKNYLQTGSYAKEAGNRTLTIKNNQISWKSSELGLNGGAISGSGISMTYQGQVDGSLHFALSGGNSFGYKDLYVWPKGVKIPNEGEYFTGTDNSHIRVPLSGGWLQSDVNKIRITTFAPLGGVGGAYLPQFTYLGIYGGLYYLKSPS
ncbi:MAG: DUF6287 domain-containing protein [Streptococcaceae bacterium]|nr:DUF6287 domain-containing protein [Streptococcaceae bacterium]